VALRQRRRWSQWRVVAGPGFADRYRPCRQQGSWRLRTATSGGL